MMRDALMPALKEWAVVCRALEEGRQVLLLRKGGIMEYRQGFQILHNKFLLFPTLEHQNETALKPDYVKNLELTSRNVVQYEKNKNKITSYAEVAEIQRVTDRCILPKLEKYHIWNENYVNIRMDYNPKKYMTLIILRVYKMDAPFEVELKPEWAGCKSWIYIQFSNQNELISRIKGEPVIDDVRFDQVRSIITEAFR